MIIKQKFNLIVFLIFFIIKIFQFYFSNIFFDVNKFLKIINYVLITIDIFLLFIYFLINHVI